MISWKAASSKTHHKKSRDKPGSFIKLKPQISIFNFYLTSQNILVVLVSLAFTLL
jgi:hypothetical protein